MGDEDLVDPPAPLRRSGECYRAITGVDDGGVAARIIVQEPDVIVAERRKADDLDHYQTPVFGIDAHGSAGASASPSWSNSTEMLSGERTKAIRPSRGGRLMVTPASINLAQSA